MADRQETPTLTAEEKRAIAALERTAARWPKSLTLFSQSGTLVVLKIPRSHFGAEILRYEVARITGIPNDGGDADY